MAAILCLAHYCDTHGPTPLMTCEGLPVGCSVCFDEDGMRIRRGTSRSHSAKSDGSNRMSNSFIRTVSTVFDEQDVITQVAPSIPAAMDTPPESPRLATALPHHRTQARRDSSFRRTYDDNDRKRAVPCENCALTIPTKIKEQIPDGAPGSPIKNGQPFSGSSPILRTRIPYARVPGRLDSSTSLPDSQSSSTTSDSSQSDPMSSDGTRTSATAAAPKTNRNTRVSTSSTISVLSSDSSSTSSQSSHAHYIEYTSSHDPQTSQSFSALRASCLRTLSCETLPPSSTGPAPTTPTSPYGPRPPHLSNQVSGGGGPLFFGDNLAGYTTAFIFRVPDPYARGRRRIYAFICLSTAKEGKAMQGFGCLSKAFRELASWIQGLAEVEADRVDGSIAMGTSEGVMRSASSNSAHQLHRHESVGSIGGTPSSGGGFGGGAFSGSGGGAYSRRGGMGSVGGAGPYMNSPKSRGLAELVGRPDFFLDLHARFVALSAQMASLGM